jgi:hypothetical protein
MEAIPVLFFMTIVPMFGVEALRAGWDLGFASAPSEGVVTCEEEVFISGVEMSQRSSEDFLGRAGISFIVLATGAEFVR